MLHSKIGLTLQNLILLGDMNADCAYLPNKAKQSLRLRKENSYQWLVDDDADTTVAAADCAYDRWGSFTINRLIPR